ncbi:hypothetical protein NS263_06035 [Curtobacterium oceanosedimentum]|uniref:Uncharacterized protein n=1 Tax=Curtobacterium oceanosedimentum TaxID=465820 RepID=A0A147DNK1_9MICO|nr:hypothetical protein NS263_06035 [Curtobacterium oceanosedimentum]KTR50973.1 hypothetical protein NS359_12485 [Curtobacterium oceanosedimentum]
MDDHRSDPLVGGGLRARAPWIPELHPVRRRTDEGKSVRKCGAAVGQQSRGTDAVRCGTHQQQVLFLREEVDRRCGFDEDAGADRPELAALCTTLERTALGGGEAAGADQRDGEDSFVHVHQGRAVDRRARRG